MSKMNDGLTGLQKVRKACADAGGWGWCDEHKKRADLCEHDDDATLDQVGDEWMGEDW